MIIVHACENRFVEPNMNMTMSGKTEWKRLSASNASTEVRCNIPPSGTTDSVFSQLRPPVTDILFTHHNNRRGFGGISPKITMGYTTDVVRHDLVDMIAHFRYRDLPTVDKYLVAKRCIDRME